MNALIMACVCLVNISVLCGTKMDTNFENYLYTKKLNLNLDKMHFSWREMYGVIRDNFYGKEEHYGGQATMTTKLFSQYNCFMYPMYEFHELYEEIRQCFHEVYGGNDKHYIQCWLNVYKKGEFIDWHTHWQAETNSWHGFYCADVGEDSYTDYKIPLNGEIKEIRVKSENNLLVLGKSENDTHRSSEWTHDSPRVTLAFDIVPRDYVGTQWLNHWVPI